MSYYCKGNKCNRSSKCLRVEAYNRFLRKDTEEGFSTGLWYVNEGECMANGYEDGIFYGNPELMKGEEE